MVPSVKGLYAFMWMRLLIAVALLSGTARAGDPGSQGTPDELMAKADVYLGQRNFLDAVASLQAVVQLSPDHAAALHELSRAYAALGKNEKAQSYHTAYVAAMNRLTAAPQSLPPENRRALDREVIRFLTEWKEAWESRDIHAYMRCYSQAFRAPGGIDRQGWQARKQQVFQSAQWIHVAMEGITIKPEGRAMAVSFRQAYESDDLSDAGSKKMLLSWTDGAWTILSEAWSALGSE